MLVSELRNSLASERGSQQDLSQRERVAVDNLQAALDLERSKMLDMQAALRKERIKVQVGRGFKPCGEKFGCRDIMGSPKSARGSSFMYNRNSLGVLTLV